VNPSDRYKAETCPHFERFLIIFPLILPSGKFPKTRSQPSIYASASASDYSLRSQPTSAKSQSIEQFDDIQAIGPGGGTGLKNDGEGNRGALWLPSTFYLLPPLPGLSHSCQTVHLSVQSCFYNLEKTRGTTLLELFERNVYMSWWLLRDKCAFLGFAKRPQADATRCTSTVQNQTRK
jgi:hypothetical protein